MIFDILSIENIFKRMIIFVLILLSFGTNLLIYNNNQEEINHYKPYYAKSYLFAAEHKISLIQGSATAQNEVENAKSIPVLVYHGVVPKADGVSIGIDDFKNQMFELKKQGYQTIHIDDFNKYIKGEKSLPDKSFLITFDDGRKDSYYPVDPILNELNYSAVMFVITNTLSAKSNKFHLIKNEIERMNTSGRWDIEAHTDNGHGVIPIDASGNFGHFYSNKEWLFDKNRLETDEEFNNRIYNDLQNAKKNLRNDFNVNAIGFAFPYGDYGVDSLNYPNAKQVLLQNASKVYSLLFYQTDEEKGYSLNSVKKDDLMVKRINVDTSWKAKDLMALLNKSKEKDIQTQMSSFSMDQGWIKNWGSFSFRDNKLFLEANDEIKGGSTFLDGTSTWKNFTYKADINNSGKDDISLIINYQDDGNYTYFSYNQGTVRIIKKVKNQNTEIAKATTNEGFTNQNIVLKVMVEENMVTGFVNNKEVVRGTVTEPRTGSGGIGVMVWNESNNNAVISVNAIFVSKNDK